MTSKDSQPIIASAIAADKGRPPRITYAEMISAMTLEAALAPEDDEVFDPKKLYEAMLNADSFEAAIEMQDSSLRSGKNTVGVAHTILGFRLRPSDAKYAAHSLGVYAIVQAVDLETQEEFSYGVGAGNVLVILWQARQFGRIPGDFIINSRDTQEGELLSLKTVGRRTVRVSAE